MAVTIHINGKSNSLVHKGSTGIAKSTIPDVCKTPSPGGPVPIPYPIIVSMSSDLTKGTKTVKVDGKNMAAVKGSEFSRCSGDEAGTAGGVKSSTNMKEATWLLYSFDVKLDGKNACRLSDKMMMNHGNSACLMGATQIAVALANFEKVLCQIVKQCEEEVNEKKIGPGGKPTREWCHSTNPATGNKNYLDMGKEKGECCERKVNERQEKSTTDFSKKVTAEPPNIDVPGGGKCRPDVIVGIPPSCDAVYDFKSSCPLTPRSRPSWPTYGSGGRRAPNPGYNGKTQFDIYKDACGKEPKLIHPNSEACNR